MFLYHATLYYAAATEGLLDTQSVISIVISAVISASVIAALVTGVIQYFINRRNSNIAEKKNTVDAESDIISRYKEAAAEERLQKESAVATIKNLLQITEDQVTSLKSTVDVLNNTIISMRELNESQHDIIDQITLDRDRTLGALKKAEVEIEAQKAELARQKLRIEELAKF